LLTGVVDYVVRVHGPTIFVADAVQVLEYSAAVSRTVSTRLARAQQTNTQASRHKCPAAEALLRLARSVCEETAYTRCNAQRCNAQRCSEIRSAPTRMWSSTSRSTPASTF